MRMRSIIPFVATCTTVVALTGCGGGGGGIPAGAVGTVGGTAITRADLGHWMSTLAGGSFYELGRGHTAPAGLVSEPANYPRCVATLEAAAAGARGAQQKPASAASGGVTAAQLLVKCRQLYEALRLQAMAYIVSAQWTIGVYGDLGVKASDADVRRLLGEMKAAEYPKPGEFQRFLAGNRRSLSDELLVLRLNVLERKLQEKAHVVGMRRVIRELSEAGRRWTAKTDCLPGYVVPHCRQFRKSTNTTPSAAVLIEQVAAITGVRCVNRKACG